MTTPGTEIIELETGVYARLHEGLTNAGIIVGDDIETQTRQAINNIKSILSAAGLSLSHIVKTTVFLKDIQHFSLMNNIYKEYFYEDAPARSCFEVSNLPMNALIEIESIAIAE